MNISCPEACAEKVDLRQEVGAARENGFKLTGLDRESSKVRTYYFS